MRHEYDMGYHAPWCAACGAEDEARQDAENTFTDAQEAAFAAKMAEIRNALPLGPTWGPLMDIAVTVNNLAEELEAIAAQTFEWPHHAEFSV